MSESTGSLVPSAAVGLEAERADGDEPPQWTEPPILADPLPPPTPRRHPAWADVPASQWNDWRWQSQHAVRNAKQLVELLPMTAEERQALAILQADYKLAIPPYYFSLIDPADLLDPIRLQAVPSPLELLDAGGTVEEDPLDEDKDSPVRGLTHRYPDRALIVTTHVCTMYCRFCTRKRATMKRGGWDAVSRDDRRMVDYIAAHPEIRDVIVSGGDPLTLPIEKLAFFVDHLSAIPHVDVIRIGTRVPVTLPQRLFDDEVVDDPPAVRQDLDPDPLQPPARGHPRSPPRLRPPPDGRDADQQPRGLARRGQRQPRRPERAVPGTPADQGSPLLPVPLRPRDRRRALPDADLEGDRDHRRAARAYLGAGRADLRGRRHAGGRQDPARPELSPLGVERLGRPPELRGDDRPLPPDRHRSRSHAGRSPLRGSAPCSPIRPRS